MVIAAKLQHFVPQFVLRHFADRESLVQESSKLRIRVHDLLLSRTYSAAISRVGASNRFYDFGTRSGRRGSIDPFLTNIEGLTAPAWARLARERSVTVLGTDERLALALFITTLAARGPVVRNQITAMPGAVLAELRQRGDDTSKLEEWLKADPGEDEEVHAGVIARVASAFPEIANRAWCLYAPPDHKRFCTGDSPVVRTNELDYGPIGKRGLLQFGVVLQVALSPSLMLLIADPRAYPLAEGQTSQFAEEHLLHYNGNLAFHCDRFLYASSGTDFDVRPGMWSPGPKLRITPARPGPSEPSGPGNPER